MNWASNIALLAATFSVALAVAAIWPKRRNLARGSFALGMLLFALESVATALASGDDLSRWRLVGVGSQALVPGTWLFFALSYSRGNARESLRLSRSLLAGAFVLPILAALGIVHAALHRPAIAPGPGPWAVEFAWCMLAHHVLLLAASVLILVNLERTFRSAVGTMRWRIKFMVLGLGLLFAVRIYSSSQLIVTRDWSPSVQLVNSVALLLACLLMSWAAGRGGAFKVELYPSKEALQSSFTILLAGAYLVVVGGLARLVGAGSGDRGFPLRAFIILVAVAVLGLAMLSDRLRLRLRRFISRHFHRPLHDYRHVWTAFTERTASLLDEKRFCQEVTKLVAETFDALSITLWLIDRSQRRLVFVASSTILEAEVPALSPEWENGTALLDSLEALRKPVELETCSEPWAKELQRCNPDYFAKGGTRLCVPLVAQNQPFGLMVVGDRVSGLAFCSEDIDLLKCIADQVAAGLCNLELSGRLLQAKQLEAFQAMSAFLVHDLKNTASMLSLTLQNLPTHFDNPEFRQDALRAVANSAQHLNELIRRLSDLRAKLEVTRVATDLNALVRETIASFNGAVADRLSQELRPVPRVAIDPEQFRKVIINLLLNAQEAIAADGHIRVQTENAAGRVVLSVSDDGCGMSADFLRNGLFRPLRSTKKNGFGIGMFQSKLIVDAHEGRIDVESQPGKGTTFRVSLPAQPRP